MDDVPHLRMPLQLSGSRFATVQQDTVDELASNVMVIMSFEVGFRVEDPDFGIQPPEFEQQPLDETDITGAILAYEPRASVNIVQTFDEADPTASQMAVEVTMPEEEDLSSE